MTEDVAEPDSQLTRRRMTVDGVLDQQRVAASGRENVVDGQRGRECRSHIVRCKPAEFDDDAVFAQRGNSLGLLVVECVGRTQRGDDQYGRLAEPTTQEAGEEERCGVGEVDVIEHEHERLDQCSILDQGCGCFEQFEAVALGRTTEDEASEVRPAAWLPAEAPDDLDPWPIRCVAGLFGAPPPEHGGAVRIGRAGGLGDESGLADASGPGDGDRPSARTDRARYQSSDHVEFGPASNEDLCRRGSFWGRRCAGFHPTSNVANRCHPCWGRRSGRCSYVLLLGATGANAIRCSARPSSCCAAGR